MALSEIKNYKKSVIYFKKALFINPKFIDAYINLANSYKNLKEYEKAKNSCQKALELDPNRKKAYIFYASLLLEMNEHIQALKYLKKGTGFIKFTEKNLKII